MGCGLVIYNWFNQPAGQLLRGATIAALGDRFPVGHLTLAGWFNCHWVGHPAQEIT